LVRDGEVTYLRCFGLASYEHRVPITSDTVFRIGSVTKHLCATVVLILLKRELLALSDPIRRYVPELPECAAAITIRQLLTMTSGLRDTTTCSIFGGRGYFAIGRDQQLQLIARHEELMFGPGSQTLYSNTNSVLLTLLIERITGKSL